MRMCVNLEFTVGTHTVPSYLKAPLIPTPSTPYLVSMPLLTSTALAAIQVTPR